MRPLSRNLMPKENMLSFQIDRVKFQLRAAAIVIEDAFVLLHRIETDGFWALPGGRVEAGESSSGAVCREMQEELGETVVCEDLLYTVENFFEYGGRSNHEIGLYYRIRLDPASPLHDKTRSHAGCEEGAHLEFRWFAVDRLDEIDLKPAFLRQTLSRSVPEHQHIVVQETGLANVWIDRSIGHEDHQA